MKHKGPILTLVAGLVVAAILMVVNLSVTKDRDDALNAAAAGQSTAATPTAEAAPPTTAPPAPAPPATYAGKVTAGRASIAIATKDGKAIAYLCDGNSVEAWLQGTATNGELLLSGAENASLTGTYGNGVAAGTIRAEGKSWDFSVGKVEPPSGLYRATENVRNAEFVAGWIYVDGVQVGLGVLNGTVVTVPPVDPNSSTVTIDGIAVPVNAVDGTSL